MTDKINYIILNEDEGEYHVASDKKQFDELVKQLLETVTLSGLKFFEIKNELKLKFSIEVKGFNDD